ncbi:MAG TPA: UDP-N-acetylmuramoyl-tripeptide--D-alanyl-D-alanine ligase [Acidimicrobiales bacterium]|nr:UDP-N-acetylmuramoyl-tripeptide--D-alanyl-D-alanine ligase [Acidimicrobiales bacterium]
MRFSAGEVAKAVGGTLVGPDVTVDGASIDNRTLVEGQLFVPIVDERDGHDFIDPQQGPYLTARPAQGGTAIEVADTQAALTSLGAHARRKLGDPVIGITGSVGKTTVKDLLASILRQRFVTAASEKSFNNELGVPLTLANAPDDTQVAVIEMGARGIGHIADLCAIARPTIGVVTAVGAVHTEVFGSIDDVARGKGELVEALPERGTAVLNGDDHRVAGMAGRTSARVLLYGTDGNVQAHEAHLDDELRARFVLSSPWGDAEVRLGVAGAHQVGNALAAATAALAAGATLDDVCAGLAVAELSPWRMALGTTPTGARVLNDAYNANPISTRAALESIVALGGERRIAFLGTMAELDDPQAAHAEIAGVAQSLGVRVISVGEPRYGVEDEVATVDDAIDLAQSLGLGGGDVVLVKGSRVAGLELLASALLDLDEG